MVYGFSSLILKCMQSLIGELQFAINLLSSLNARNCLSLIVVVVVVVVVDIVCVGENWPVVNFLIHCSSVINILWGHTEVPLHIIWPGIAVGTRCSGLNDVRTRCNWKKIKYKRILQIITVIIYSILHCLFGNKKFNVRVLFHLV